MKTFTKEEYAAMRAGIVLPKLRILPPNGLVLTPPKGWNSWNKFGPKISDELIRGIALAIAMNGMRDAGYGVNGGVIIDDGWQGIRDSRGRIHANERFPNMKALTDFVHSLGLKIGIYTSPGPLTCEGFEGSFGHEEEDAFRFANWGFDFLKYDWCSARYLYTPEKMRAAYQKMGEALRATGRPIVYSICQYGLENVATWGALAGGNLWRTTGDIEDKWESMLSIIDKQAGLEKFAGPGHFNDPDMLEVGNGGMTDTEYRTHFSMWAMLAAPLIAGNDLRTMSKVTLEILTNREVIAVDQDVLGRQGKRVMKIGDTEIWTRLLQYGDYAVAFLNRGERPSSVTVSWSDLGIMGNYEIRNLWEHDSSRMRPFYDAHIALHGTVMLRLTAGDQ